MSEPEINGALSKVLGRYEVRRGAMLVHVSLCTWMRMYVYVHVCTYVDMRIHAFNNPSAQLRLTVPILS